MTNANPMTAPASTETREAVVEVKNVTAGYVTGVNILNSCSLTAYAGELIGIIGPNGAGKSTLLKAIFGMVTVRSGTISLRGDDITNLKANKLVAKGIGFVPQTNHVFGFVAAADHGAPNAAVHKQIGISSTRSGNGYWSVSSDGGIFTYGDAPFHGSMGGRALQKPIVGIASTRKLGVDPAKVNVNGGAIALGHPIGASGARVVLQLAFELRRRGGGLGAAALCGGGGQGDALVLHVPAASS